MDGDIVLDRVDERFKVKGLDGYGQMLGGKEKTREGYGM